MTTTPRLAHLVQRPTPYVPALYSDIRQTLRRLRREHPQPKVIRVERAR